MKAGLSQSTQLRQELKINPRLYQAMDLLYMPLLDLQQHLKQELLNNPFLDMIEPEEDEEESDSESDVEVEAERSLLLPPRRREMDLADPALPDKEPECELDVLHGTLLCRILSISMFQNRAVLVIRAPPNQIPAPVDQS